MEAVAAGTRASSESAQASSAGPAGLLPPQVRERFRSLPGPAVDLSVVAPAYEEEANLERLYERVAAALGEGRRWELVLVDDGSRDGTAGVIRSLAGRDPRVVGAILSRNCGQTAATAAGIQLARGAVIATLDADLQNDPQDLPAMLDLLDGRDAVVGYRIRREDDFVRRASSRIANAVRNWISKDRIRDTGCSLKVFRAEAIRAIPMFEGMHRFLPTLLRYHGFTVVEHPVAHHPRTAGRSKYGVANRAWRALQDLFAVRWMRRRRILIPIREVTDAR
jgi:dolichol-phosphate mannosyltransferase